MTLQFTKATKTQARLRLALVGPAGSGKTMTGLKIARVIAGEQGRVALIDTEHGSASKYADKFEFDTLQLVSFAPDRYIEAIHAAEAAGYTVLVIDSLSHAWAGKDGALEMVDAAATRQRSENRFTVWREVTPKHNALVEAILQSPLHVIVTMRTKTEYVMEEYEDGGRKKTKPRKVGLAPIQREGIEYEFDVFGELDDEHILTISKSHCDSLTGCIFHNPGEIGETLRAWLTDGAPMPYNFAARKQVLGEMRAQLRKLGGTPPTLKAEDGASEDALEYQIGLTKEMIAEAQQASAPSAPTPESVLPF